jgi:hypothetical protein
VVCRESMYYGMKRVRAVTRLDLEPGPGPGEAKCTVKYRGNMHCIWSEPATR